MSMYYDRCLLVWMWSSHNTSQPWGASFCFLTIGKPLMRWCAYLLFHNFWTNGAHMFKCTILFISKLLLLKQLMTFQQLGSQRTLKLSPLLPEWYWDGWPYRRSNILGHLAPASTSCNSYYRVKVRVKLLSVLEHLQGCSVCDPAQ